MVAFVVEGDADAGARCLSPHRRHGTAVRQEEVMRGGEGGFPIGDAGCEAPRLMAEERRHPGLVDRRPVADPVPESIDDEKLVACTQ